MKIIMNLGPRTKQQRGYYLILLDKVLDEGNNILSSKGLGKSIRSGCHVEKVKVRKERILSDFKTVE